MLEVFGLKIPIMDDVDLSRKKVLLRVDINVPIEPKSKEILNEWRIKRHALTVKELLDRNCSITIIAHQGRPGDEDFVSLEKHAKVLEKYISCSVNFIDDVLGEKAIKSIQAAKEGDVILLDNIRKVPEEMKKGKPEEHANTDLVKVLSKHFDYFIQDAFGAAHRPYPSIIGFPYVMPSMAGKIMVEEILSLNNVIQASGVKTLVVGGSKYPDVIKVIEKSLKSKLINNIITGGLVAELFLLAKGYNIGEENVKVLIKKAKGEEKFKSLLAKAQEILDKVEKTSDINLFLPVDFAIDKNGERVEVPINQVSGIIKDIGSSTVEKYSKIILESDFVVMKGTMGVIENELFRFGTYKLVEAMIKSKAKVIIGGGHATFFGNMLEKGGKKDYYLSTGGGAMLLFIAGERLPALKALDISYRKFFR